MVGTSLWDYIFIRGCVIALHLVAPLSTTYLASSWVIDLPFRLPRSLEIWLGLETAFYLLVFFPLRAHLQTPATHPATVSREDRRKLFWRCHDNIPDAERYIRKWFLDAPPEEIKRENVKQFFRWAFLNTADPDPKYDDELEEYTAKMEKMLGRTLEPGMGKAKCLRLSLDPVQMLHRSLTWYFVSFPEMRTLSMIANNTVCDGGRYFDHTIHEILLFRLLSHIFEPFLRRLPIPPPHHLCATLLPERHPHILAPTSHLQDQAANIISPRYWHRSVSLHRFPG